MVVGVCVVVVYLCVGVFVFYVDCVKVFVGVIGM